MPNGSWVLDWVPIDWNSDLWRELSQRADKGNEHYQQLIRKLKREEREAVKTE
jgi:hypothetical protein